MAQTSVGRFSGGESEWRRLAFFMAGLVLILLATTTRVVGSEGDALWRGDFKAALQEAEERKLPLIVHFYADWCIPCKRMDREVFASPTVRDVVSRRFVAVKVNSDKHQELVRQYGIETLPSDVLLDSLTGKTIAIYSGYQDQNNYLSNATMAESMFIKAHASELITKKPPQAADQINLGDPQPLIGLDGFSPVALTKNRQWNRGSSKFAWDFKDVTYYLTSREELMEFRENPEAYAPKLLGCDPVILLETDKAVAGDIRFGAFFDDELFLFKTEERRRQFKASPEKYIRQQHALKVDQIERTVMR